MLRHQFFKQEVHAGFIFGNDDQTFTQTFKGSASAECHFSKAVTQPTYITPHNSQESRSALVRYWDEIAACVAASMPDTAAATKLVATGGGGGGGGGAGGSSTQDTLSGFLVLLEDVNTDAGSSSSAGAGAGAGAQQHHHHPQQQKPWSGRIMSEQFDDEGNRYFVPQNSVVALYHKELNNVPHLLYGGRVVGITGYVMHRDAMNNIIRSISVRSVVPATIPRATTTMQSQQQQLKKGGSPYNVDANFIDSDSDEDEDEGATTTNNNTNNNDKKQSSTITRKTLTVANTAPAAPLRIHFVPLPAIPTGGHGGGTGLANFVEEFAKEAVYFLGSPNRRASSLVVFVGSLMPPAIDNRVSPANYFQTAKLMLENIQSACQDVRHGGDANTNQQHPALPVMFVPHLSDLALDGAALPQHGFFYSTPSSSNNNKDSAEQSRAKASNKTSSSVLLSTPACFSSPALPSLMFPANPAIFSVNGLRICATSVDAQSALMEHATKPTTPASERSSAASRFKLYADTVRSSGLSVPFISNNHDFQIEPSALSRMQCVPHIHFSPTHASNTPRCCMSDGTLFLSCNGGPQHPQQAATGKFQVLEVDVMDSSAAVGGGETESSSSSSSSSSSAAGVRVRTIEIART